MILVIDSKRCFYCRFPPTSQSSTARTRASTTGMGTCPGSYQPVLASAKVSLRSSFLSSHLLFASFSYLTRFSRFSKARRHLSGLSCLLQVSFLHHFLRRLHAFLHSFSLVLVSFLYGFKLAFSSFNDCPSAFLFSSQKMSLRSWV
jgi:hypothetical protein